MNARQISNLKRYRFDVLTDRSGSPERGHSPYDTRRGRNRNTSPFLRRGEGLAGGNIDMTVARKLRSAPVDKFGLTRRDPRAKSPNLKLSIRKNATVAVSPYRDHHGAVYEDRVRPIYSRAYSRRRSSVNNDYEVIEERQGRVPSDEPDIDVGYSSLQNLLKDVQTQLHEMSLAKQMMEEAIERSHQAESGLADIIGAISRLYVHEAKKSRAQIAVLMEKNSEAYTLLDHEKKHRAYVESILMDLRDSEEVEDHYEVDRRRIETVPLRRQPPNDYLSSPVYSAKRHSPTSQSTDNAHPISYTLTDQFGQVPKMQDDLDESQTSPKRSPLEVMVPSIAHNKSILALRSVQQQLDEQRRKNDETTRQNDLLKNELSKITEERSEIAQLVATANERKRDECTSPSEDERGEAEHRREQEVIVPPKEMNE